MTPHLGTFEVLSLFIGSQMPMTAMFRTPLAVAWSDDDAALGVMHTVDVRSLLE